MARSRAALVWRRMAETRQGRVRNCECLATGSNRRGALPRMDRRAGRPVRRRLLADSIYASAPERQMVASESRARARVDRAWPDASGGAQRDRTGSRRRPLRRRVFAAKQGGGSRGSRVRARSKSARAAHVRSARSAQPVCDPVSRADCKEAGDARQPDRKVRLDVAPRPDYLSTNSKRENWKSERWIFNSKAKPR